jgi:pyruvate/2-oxoglutarate dehydrogenase complex dihydrolipoamide dehydrogenase (E3) component
VLGAGRAGIAAAVAALGLRIGPGGVPTPSGDDPGRNGDVQVVLVDGAPVGRAGWGGRIPLSVLAAAVAEGVDWERARRMLLDERRQAQPRHDALLAQLREASGGRLTVVPGRARFVGHGRVLVRPRGTVGDRQVELRGRRIVVATGSTAARPRARGLDEIRYVTTGELDLLFEEEEPPASVAVIGAGASGCAIAQLLARLGIQVTVVEAADRVLPREDPEVAEVVAEALRRDGVRVMRSLEVTTFAPTLDGGAWFGTQDGGDIAAERLVVATGWRPDTEGLSPERAGVPVTHGGAVVVDGRLSAGSVFAAGSATGSRPHPLQAVAMGRVAGGNAVRRRSRARWEGGFAPHASLTDPVVVRVGTGLIGGVGARRGSARSGDGREGLFVSVRTADGTGRSRAAQRLMGVTAVGPGAEDLIAVPTLALRAGVPVDRLRKLVVTEGSGVGVLQRALGSLTAPSDGSGRPASPR